MPDMTRDEVLRYVFRRLSDQKFAERLTARGPDGSRPIVPVLASDPCSYMLSEVANFGGSANVVVGMPAGLVAFALVEDKRVAAPKEEVGPLDANCTVGVFVARMLADGGSLAYSFRSATHSGRTGAPALLEA